MGILKENLPNSFLIKSAGTKPEPVNKYAIKVMSLININISKMNLITLMISTIYYLTM